MPALRPADSSLTGAPFRLLHKGQEYFQRQSAPSRRLSAVERLEADKAKYVKSQQVALTRQPPVIRKALLPPPLYPSPTGPRGARRQRQSPVPSREESAGRGVDLQRLILDVCDGSPSGSQSSPSCQSINSGENRPPLPLRTKPLPVPTCPPHARLLAPPTVTVRRVDVRPQVRTPQRRPLQAAARATQAPPPSPPMFPPQNPLLSHVAPPLSPAVTRLSSTSSRGSAHKHAALHRSKSDLSDRFSRASADRERFFNYCGLEAELVQALGAEAFTRANSDIITPRHSLSTPSSDDDEGEEPLRGRSPYRGEEPLRGRSPYSISVIERNARVIKWLYGLRQATGGGDNAVNINGQER